ncbi:MAG TPA: DNA methyltransferase [Nitrososphaeraceae archaeon]|nr:DNA methyltransferase [Nitrososphaeraceae archaeon]
MTIIEETYPTIQIKDIIINDRHRKDFGNLEELARNIEEVGLLHPITLDQHNRLIDGERRLLSYEYLGKTEIPYFRINIDEIVLGEFSANSYRKDWTVSEIVAIKRTLEPYFKQQARQRQLIDKPLGNVSKGRALDKIGKMLGKDRKTISKMEYIVKRKDRNPEKYQKLLNDIDSKKSSVDKVFKIMEKDEKREELLKSESNNLELPENCKLLLGDFRRVPNNQIADNSIDLIFTDPPYADTPENLSLYEDLARLAIRTLKPGSSLVFYVGHIILHKVIQIFSKYSPDNNDSGLKFWWMFAVKHNGNHNKIFPRHIFSEYKPLLWYVKGNKINDLLIANTIGDYIESTPPSKVEHDWQQSATEAEYILKNLTIENQTVLDPMMGSGTTGLAALNLRRKFIGIEKNLETFEIAKIRINKQPKYSIYS